jgi:hypothetical protein
MQFCYFLKNKPIKALKANRTQHNLNKMKLSRALLLFFCAFCCTRAIAQPLSVFENFNNNNHGWTFSSGAQQGHYNDPSDECENGRGVIASAPTDLNPIVLTSPLLQSSGSGYISVSFNIFKTNEGLTCNSWGDVDCPVYVSVQIESGNNIVATSSNVLLPVIGPGKDHRLTLRVATLGNLPASNLFKATLKLTYRNTNPACNNINTKFIFDEISVCQDACAAALDAVNDEGFTYDGPGSETFTGNLSSNDNIASCGTVEYTLAKGPLGINKSTIGGATININSNGNFTITRTDPNIAVFEFSYRAKNNCTGKSDLSAAKIYFASSGPLPLSLLQFSAARKNNQVFVNWKTSNESNLNFFEIQRKINGQFMPVGKVAANNNAGQTNYQFSEMNTSSSISEYRLKITENNGTNRYSEISIVKGIEKTINWLIYPNPNNGIASLHFNQSVQNGQVTLIDNTGRLIKTYAVSGQQLNLLNLKAGIYMVKFTTNEGVVTTQKMIVY